MKSILICLPCLKIGGTEIKTLRLVEALIEGGYNVVTVCYFEYDFLMVQQFKAVGSKVVCLSAYGNRPLGVLQQYKFLRTGLKRVVNEYRPKIAHVQYMAPGAMPIIILHRLGVKTILTTAHTMADIYNNLRIVHYIQRHYVRAFTCITELAEKSFFGSSQIYTTETVLAKRNHFTIHNTLAPRYPFADESKQLKDDKVVTIGVVSRLVPLKGVDLVLPAFAQLKQQYSNVQLIILGEGPLRDNMQQQERDLQLGGYVKWLDNVSSEQLPQIYKDIDILWVPSRSEGFGLTALEAMAKGCVVVASQVGGLQEVLHNDIDNLDMDCGVFFESGSITDVAAKTQALIADKFQYGVLSDQSIQRAKDFQFEYYKKKVLNLYAKL